FSPLDFAPLLLREPARTRDSECPGKPHMSRIPHGHRLIALPLGLVALAIGPLRAQEPLAPIRPSGQSVTPAFEGWYRNADGTFSISFGYYNRNAEEAVEVPVGAANFIAPGDSNQGQANDFHGERQLGGFAGPVPAHLGDKKVVW